MWQSDAGSLRPPASRRFGSGSSAGGRSRTLRQALDLYDAYQGKIGECDGEIEKALAEIRFPLPSRCCDRGDSRPESPNRSSRTYPARSPALPFVTCARRRTVCHSRRAGSRASRGRTRFSPTHLLRRDTSCDLLRVDRHTPHRSTRIPE